MALMNLLKSFALLSSIVSLSYVFRPIPLTSCNLLMLASSDHSSLLGWIGVIARLGRSLSVHLLSSQRSKKVVLGPSIGPYSQTMILQPAFHIPQRHAISCHSLGSHHPHCWTRTLIANRGLTVILNPNHENYILECIPRLIVPITAQACCLHQLPLPLQYLQQLTLTWLSIPHQCQLRCHFPFLRLNFITIRFFLHEFPILRPAWNS